MTQPHALQRWLDRIPGRHVVCIGDVMLDRYVYGSVDRVSPEAPIPIVRVDREEAMPGGAANVVRNIVALGACATLLARRGKDTAGAELERLLKREPRVQATLCVEARGRTTVKTRYVAGIQQLLRADREHTLPLAPARVRTLLAAFDNAVSAASPPTPVVLSDYGKGVLSEDLVREILGRAKAAGAPVLVDPKARDFARYGGADLITPNQRELAAAVGRTLESDDDVAAAAGSIIESCAIAAVLVTRGERGMTLVEAGGAVAHLPVRAREVFDVSGAGDTAIAAVAVATAAGAPLVEAAALANYAAAIVVGKSGTAAAYSREISAALHHAQVSTSEAKIDSLEAALARAAEWRRRGLRIGFTNGCFDLLHPGHVSLLEQARAACDRLVVGLNSDASTRRLKGAGRPFNKERERAVLLASHGTVDLLVPFDDDTPMGLIEALRPDVLVKGADYALDEVVGGAFVRDYGGQVLLATVKPGYSTTDTLAKLAR